MRARNRLTLLLLTAVVPAGLSLAETGKKSATSVLNRGSGPFMFTADEPPTAEIYTSVTLELLQAALTHMDMQPKLDKDNDGDPCFVITYDKHRATALLYGKDGAFTSLGLISAFVMTGKADPVKASAWNLKYRYTRAAADDKTYYLMADLDLEGGLSAPAIGRWFSAFKTPLADYVKYIGFE